MANISGLIFTAIYGGVLFFLCLFGLHRALMVYLYHRHRNNLPETQDNNDFLPSVTVQLPMYNEKLVVERLIDSVAAFDYPADKLEIQLLDDSTDETAQIADCMAKEYSRRGLNIVYLHRKDRVGYKAGALNYGMERSRGEFIAVFDADFVPNPDFLRKTISYFRDPKVGMVQARWGYLNADHNVLTRIQAMLLDGHFFLESGARARSGRFFNFNGTAGVWRRSAIDDSGGWQYDTLTEDLDLSYRAQMRKWKFIFLPQVSAPSELPIEMNAFKCQQFRWTKGSIQTGKKVLPALLKSDESWKVKIEGLFHMGSHLSYVFLLMLCVLMPFSLLALKADPLSDWPLTVFHLFFLGTIAVALFYAVAAHESGQGVLSHALMIVPLMALGAGMSVNNSRAVIEGWGGKESEFIRTPKYHSGKGAPRAAAYRANKDSYAWAELAVGLHLTAGSILALQMGVYPALPFLMLFQAGFYYVSLLSFSEQHAVAKSVEGAADLAGPHAV